ncbi:uncharacterized protein LOC127240688 isoform X1 [Andrographis paniculata]|uniref:uncharacterized protein LOC127240688 isoform X1 n=1 Tax=Andrographis paniculata TaxID=175694 RepID=UPI0021E72404|nr:uncharacterized protein LOC127240688 isoform X1 [Andrographis paniculata]XP_051115453.1 uncharacterized protein LOC127240688 isoform X1 [Andrographis paniculata]
MASGVCFSQGSKTWIALLVPVVAVFARLSSSFHGLLLPFSLLIIFSTLICLSTVLLKPKTQTLISKPAAASPPSDHHHHRHLQLHLDHRPPDAELMEAVKENPQAVRRARALIQDLYSESDRCSCSTSSEDHSSDTEWPYNNLRRHEGGGGAVDCSDDDDDDEDSLFEIAIPSGLSLYPSQKCKDSSMADINDNDDDDNLIEIDINIGSIKYCSSFDTY